MTKSRRSSSTSRCREQCRRPASADDHPIGERCRGGARRSVSRCIVGALATFFGLSFSALLPLINPLGSALVFLGLVGAAPPDTYRALAARIAVSTALFLFVIEAIGTAALRFFGISLPVMQVSGGLVLAAMGWTMLNREEPDARSETVKRKALDDAALAS